jgi:hypothetical protein
MPCLPERPIEAVAESECPSSPSFYLPSNLDSAKLDLPSPLHRRPRQTSFDSVFPITAPTRFNEVVRASLVRRTDQSPTKPRRRLEPATEEHEARGAYERQEDSPIQVRPVEILHMRHSKLL